MAMIRFRLLLLLEALRKTRRTFAVALFAPRIMGGSPEGDDDAKTGEEDDDSKDDEGKKDEEDEKDEKDPKDEEDDDDDDEAGKKDGEDPAVWKRRARRAQRDFKRQKARADELELKQREQADANKSEREKEIDAARKDAEEKTTAKFETERRQDRLEVATTQIASKGVKMEVKDGDKTVEKTVKFADAEDALVHLQAQINRGNIDASDIFGDDGKVNKEALSDALVELLEAKPHLAAEGKSGKKSETAGDGDQGKGGDKGGGKGPEEMSVDEHFEQIHRGGRK